MRDQLSDQDGSGLLGGVVIGSNPYYAEQTRVSVANDELVTVRDTMRGLNRMVEQLQSGEREQFVLMHHGRMVARLVPVDVRLAFDEESR